MRMRWQARVAAELYRSARRLRVFTMRPVTIAVSFTAIAGLAGLGTETASWYYTQRSMQGATDVAAHTGATAKMMGTSSSAAITEAKSVAASYGFTTGVTVNIPPTSGSHISDTDAVEVIISQSMPVMFLRLCGSWQLVQPTTARPSASWRSGMIPA